MELFGIFRWNYIIGAYAAGGAIGMWKNCVVSGWGYGTMFGNFDEHLAFD